MSCLEQFTKNTYRHTINFVKTDINDYCGDLRVFHFALKILYFAQFLQEKIQKHRTRKLTSFLNDVVPHFEKLERWNLQSEVHQSNCK